jgi:hypothetical protein
LVVVGTAVVDVGAGVVAAVVTFAVVGVGVAIGTSVVETCAVSPLFTETVLVQS